jgi:hypothetical protein
MLKEVEKELGAGPIRGLTGNDGDIGGDRAAAVPSSNDSYHVESHKERRS